MSILFLCSNLLTYFFLPLLGSLRPQVRPSLKSQFQPSFSIHSSPFSSSKLLVLCILLQTIKFFAMTYLLVLCCLCCPLSASNTTWLDDWSKWFSVLRIILSDQMYCLYFIGCWRFFGSPYLVPCGDRYDNLNFFYTILISWKLKPYFFILLQIANYMPTNEDLDYPEKLKRSAESTSEINPVKCLSLKLYFLFR